MEKETSSLTDTIKDLNKRYGDGSILQMNKTNLEKIKIESVSTNCIPLDEVFGCGGMPKGRIVEVFGMESSGKSTLALYLVSQIQKSGGKAVWVDAEFAFSREHAEKIGVKVDELIIAQPTSGEEALDTVNKMAETGGIDIIVLDSVAALIPEKELAGEISDEHMALQARMMGKGMRIIAGTASRSKTLVIFINQLREKVGVFYGKKTVTPGGKALKFFSSVRLEVKKGDDIKDKAGVVVGNWMKVCGVKNKVGFPFRETEFELLYLEGIDVVGVNLDLAIKKEIIEKAGNTLTYGKIKLGVGRDQAKAFLKEDKATFAKITEELKKSPNK